MRSRTGLVDFYERYSRSVSRRARTLLCDDEAARYVTQEVFSRLLCRDDGGVDPRNAMTWSYRTVTRLCLQRLREPKRRRTSSLQVERVLERAPEELQEAAIYYYVDELSSDEIATVLGESRRSVGSRLRALNELTRERAAR
jgi:DNA-directed RNA polymerase specialized sigma24 family protein